ncbi:MAG: hypothetical protein ACYDHG_11615 [Desulfomonilaceae bacterium]
MPVSARKASGVPKEELIKHQFDDPELQAEFDALNSNEDRSDYIEAFKGFRRLASRRTFSHEEVKALLGIE